MPSKVPWSGWRRWRERMARPRRPRRWAGQRRVAHEDLAVGADQAEDAAGAFAVLAEQGGVVVAEETGRDGHVDHAEQRAVGPRPGAGEAEEGLVVHVADLEAADEGAVEAAGDGAEVVAPAEVDRLRHRIGAGTRARPAVEAREQHALHLRQAGDDGGEGGVDARLLGRDIGRAEAAHEVVHAVGDLGLAVEHPGGVLARDLAEAHHVALGLVVRAPPVQPADEREQQQGDQQAGGQQPLEQAGRAAIGTRRPHGRSRRGGGGAGMRPRGAFQTRRSARVSGVSGIGFMAR